MKKSLFLIVIILGYFQNILFSQSIGIDSATHNLCSKYNESLIATFGTYANPPRLADGHIDLKRLITELKDLHANTYNWLIRNNNDDLEALKHFLPLARKAKMRVWVTLLPPSEPPYSEPYKLDYEKWATQLANISLIEKNLVAWSIDDFVHNLKIFTPEYVEKFLTSACAINPKFAFIPCSYFRQITPSFVANYGHLLNGILFPYRAESVGANLKDSSQVENEITQLRKMFRPAFPIFLDIYATAHSRLGASTPEYVKEVLRAGMNAANGVLIYCHQDPVKSPEKYQIIKNGFRHNPKLKKNSKR
jgi:hypothetical protein